MDAVATERNSKISGANRTLAVWFPFVHLRANCSTSAITSDRQVAHIKRFLGRNITDRTAKHSPSKASRHCCQPSSVKVVR